MNGKHQAKQHVMHHATCALLSKHACVLQHWVLRGYASVHLVVMYLPQLGLQTPGLKTLGLEQVRFLSDLLPVLGLLVLVSSSRLAKSRTQDSVRFAASFDGACAEK